MHDHIKKRSEHLKATDLNILVNMENHTYGKLPELFQRREQQLKRLQSGMDDWVGSDELSQNEKQELYQIREELLGRQRRLSHLATEAYHVARSGFLLSLGQKNSGASPYSKSGSGGHFKVKT